MVVVVVGIVEVIVGSLWRLLANLILEGINFKLSCQPLQPKRLKERGLVESQDWVRGMN